MKILLTHSDGTVVDSIDDVEQWGLEIVNGTGGVALAAGVRTRLSTALYPYWTEVRDMQSLKGCSLVTDTPKTRILGGNVVEFKKK